MRIRLFQIDPQKDSLRRMFCGLREFEAAQGCKGVDLSIYDSVLNCEVEASDLEEDVSKKFRSETSQTASPLTYKWEVFSEG